MVQRRALLALLLAGLAGCSTSVPPSSATSAVHKATPGSSTSTASKQVIRIEPGPNVQEEVQTALIKAKPGDTIEFTAGKFEFTKGLSLAVDGVTIRGQGIDKTTLSFKKQDAGKEGLLVTRDKFAMEDLAVEDTKGDALKVNGTDGVTFRKVRAQWTGGSKASNGAYGFYPVQCKNILIEDCVAIGASDAGIYVGQSKNIVVRRCRAEGNVAGIEIENSTDADVYDNVATNNAGGLLVFDLPGLEVKHGQRVRVFKNRVVANNHENFAPKGNTVASVSPGTGMVVMATDQVELFDNTLKDNQTYGLAITSYVTFGKRWDDKEYDPISEGIYVHNNTFSGNGTKPDGEGARLSPLVGEPIPDIIFDGVRNPAKLVNGADAPGQGIYIKNNGKATFANVHLDKLDLKDPAASLALVERDLRKYEGELPALTAVSIPGVQ
jgi:parallel beta-helix repeat protein